MNIRNLFVVIVIIGLQSYSSIAQQSTPITVAETIIFPGLGQSIRYKDPRYLIIGGAAYASLTGAYLYHSKAITNYDNYLIAKTAESRHTLSQQWHSQRQMAQALFAASVSIWIADIIWTTAQGISDKKPKTSGYLFGCGYDPIIQSPIISLKINLKR